MKKFFLVLSLLVILAIVLNPKGAWDRTLLLISILNLEISNSEYAQVFENDKITSYIAKNRGDFEYDVVKKFMENKEWKFKEQMGSGLIFEKKDETTLIGIEGVSDRYTQWNVSNEVLN
ncbi:hypothetical protein [Metabacillus fastidiosus]|uniref:Uncharacterized protein n=1 Tax=Metabacillus fastidiosus TaxID=1458 RepID=A0ABU6NZL6_9BACI|nr:hypothetical protein [Metabacillus fastidiosus]MED4402123.1 hypothetical protein [Metabacillus fastidiosus]